MKFVDGVKDAGADVGIDTDGKGLNQQWNFEPANGEFAIFTARQHSLLCIALY